MTKLFSGLWRVIRFPIVLISYILLFPVRAFQSIRRFLNEEITEDRPATEVVVSVITDETARRDVLREIDIFRKHLLRIVIGLAIGVGISFYFVLPLMDYLTIPIGGLENLQAIEVTEEVGVLMRVALTSGLAIMLPYIAFEIWLFAAPGLHVRARKFGLLGIPLATILFLLGAAFTYFILLPAALPFLGGITKIAQFWTARDYFGFVTGLMIWIGLFFEFPLVIYILTSMGLVKPKLLAQQWRLAIVIIAIIAAMVTPTVDAVTMGLVMLPLSLLYFISIGLSYIAYAGRRRTIAETEANLS